MTRRIGIAAALGLLLAATACGTAANTGNAGGPDSGTASTAVSSPGSPPPSGANQATPDPTVVALHPVHWDKVTPGPGNQIVVQYTASGRPECSKLGRVDVTETDQSVEVSVQLGQARGVDCSGPQPMIAALFQTTVELRAPLGSRSVR